MDAHVMSRIAFILGIGSVLASAALWMQTRRQAGEGQARAERSALFVGLWAPSLFALATYFRLAP